MRGPRIHHQTVSRAHLGSREQANAVAGWQLAMATLLDRMAKESSPCVSSAYDDGVACSSTLARAEEEEEEATPVAVSWRGIIIGAGRCCC